MKAGVVYPQIELGGDTGAAKAFAQAAEGLGYDHVVIYDHVLGAEHAGREPKLIGPYKENDPFHEPLVTYPYLAGITKKLELVTGVIILPQRQTALFAKQAIDVDLFWMAGFASASESAGTGWNSTASKCPDTFVAAAMAGAADRVDPQAVAGAGDEYGDPTIGSIEPEYCRGQSGKSRSGSAVRARPPTTERPGSRTDFCSEGGPKPRRSRSRRKSKPN
jgi:hypothetical protein